MKNKFKNCIKMIFALLAVILFCDTATVKASATEDEFIKGMDLSSLEAIEDAGGVFYFIGNCDAIFL